MAGLWPKCSDGTLMEPVDLILLLFPLLGAENKTTETCFVMVPYTVPITVKSSQFYSTLASYLSPKLADEFLDSFICLAILCLLLTLAMAMCFVVLNRLDPTFRNVAPAHKKWYIVANLCKSFLLGLSCTSTKYWAAAYRCYALDRFPGIPLKRTMAVYAVTDVVALWMVPKLPTSTLIHHITSAVLYFVACASDMTEQGWTGNLGVSKMIVVYGNISTVAYLVNAYLALRVLYSPSSRSMISLCVLAFWSYIVCCAGNWGIHLIWIVNGIVTMSFSWAAVAYIAAVLFVVNDDIVLLRWLWNRSSPGAEGEGEKEK